MRSRAMRTNTRARDPARRSQPSRSHRSGRVWSHTRHWKGRRAKQRRRRQSVSQSVAANRSHARSARSRRSVCSTTSWRADVCLSCFSHVRAGVCPIGTYTARIYITARIRDSSRLVVESSARFARCIDASTLIRYVGSLSPACRVQVHFSPGGAAAKKKKRERTPRQWRSLISECLASASIGRILI